MDRPTRIERIKSVANELAKAEEDARTASSKLESLASRLDELADNIGSALDGRKRWSIDVSMAVYELRKGSVLLDPHSRVLLCKDLKAAADYARTIREWLEEVIEYGNVPRKASEQDGQSRANEERRESAFSQKRPHGNP